MLLSTILALLLLPIAALGGSATLLDALYNGSVKPESIAAAGDLDMPKIRPGVNATSYDWWYFDVVSTDARASVTIVFYDSGPEGFINPYERGPLSVSITGLFPNGSAYDFSAPATSAVVSRHAGGSFATSGVYKDSGFEWKGTTSSDDGEVTYVVSIDAPSIGVNGTVSFKSIAPPHYPCGLNVPGATEQLFPHVFWSNAIPDALAQVDLSLAGAELKFDGYGYHDKNWGDTPFVTTTATWYWGHAHLGPYSIVWFDAVDSVGTEHFSGYVAKGGKVLLSSCAKDSAVARPWGANDTYPPTVTTGVMQGLDIQFDLGHGKTFWANVSTTAVAIDFGVYVRTLGTVTGGLHGCSKTFDGIALFEEFKFTS
ncbi:hypothetical protein V1525DRAFT_422544 [Lipomyces kononenkoae]|uniref:Uncharacterized protein n=1 Tax=Lipomyces kononenkoae TaxID=34357 RepID=A0ACC3SR83_LIPKO